MRDTFYGDFKIGDASNEQTTAHTTAYTLYIISLPTLNCIFSTRDAYTIGAEARGVVQARSDKACMLMHLKSKPGPILRRSCRWAEKRLELPTWG